MRKQYLLVGISLLVSVVLLSQISIPTYSTADTAKVNLLLDSSKANFSENPKKAIEFAEQAKKLADAVQFNKGVAYALKNIGIANYYQGKNAEALNFWKLSLEIFKSIKDQVGVANILNNIGAIYFNQGDDANALDYYLQSLQLAEKINDKLRILTANNNIGGVYFNKLATHDKALIYFLKALPLSEELNDKEAIGTASVNLGEIYFVKKDDERALFYFNKSAKAFNNSENSPYSYNAIGKVYARQEKYDLAITYHKKALAIAEKLNGQLDIVQSLMGLAKTNIQRGDFINAIAYLKRAEKIALAANFSIELKNTYESFSNVYGKMGNFKNAFIYQSKFSSIKDTLYNIETDKKLGSLQFDFDIQKKQGEINLLTINKALQETDLKRQKFATYAFLIGFILVLLGAINIFRNYLRKIKVNKLLDKQKEEIEGLLLNILPAEVAKELQDSGNATPKSYKKVSVLFSDFKGFTRHAENMTPEALVEELNTCFVAFDEIVGKYNLEKIKTIGDAYMCAGGIPADREGHVFDIISASLEMQQYIESHNLKRTQKGLESWDLRIGIHVGPIVAGVVGKKKYAYDIWGSTVNIASRMESNGEAGRVNISEVTYELIKEEYKCTHRGKIYAKNVGEIDMYFIDEKISFIN